MIQSMSVYIMIQCSNSVFTTIDSLIKLCFICWSISYVKTSQIHDNIISAW